MLPDKEKEEPAGIISLKSILKRYEEEYEDFYHNEAALLEFFNTCREAVGEEIIKLDKKNPNACELYKALIHFEKDKIHVLHEERLKVHEFNILAPRLFENTKHPSIKEHIKNFQKVCLDRSDRPYLLLLQDYLFNVNRSNYIDGDIKVTYRVLANFVKAQLMKEDSLFLKAFPTPTALALCIRKDMYCPVMHHKKGWVSYLNTYDKREAFCSAYERDIDSIAWQIIYKAFSGHFDAIFKNVKDVEVFLQELALSKNASYSDGPNFDIYSQAEIKRILCGALVARPEFLIKIAAADQKTRNHLYKALPGLEDAVKKQTYQSSVLGLFAAKKIGEGAVLKLDKHILRKIARHAAEEAGSKPDGTENKKLKK